MKQTSAYKIKQYLSSVFMMMALLWLTVSMPFIFKAQQQLAVIEKKANPAPSSTDKEEDPADPLTNTNEEKAPSSFNTINEYLNDATLFLHAFCLMTPPHISYTDDTYTAFHGELTGPPPKA